MRFYLSTLLFLTLVACSEASDNENVIEEPEVDENYCSCSELVFDEPYNRFYLTERKKPFTGVCEEYYDNGQLSLKKEFKDGKNHGMAVSYYENGQIKEQKEFDTNFQVGEQINYTPDGDITYHALYKRGKQTEILVIKPK
ncbi:MAG: hypothetical protein MI810_09125 [Flavobacteriales bacterium]|jgi:antitoxin component YwqK of YwqJK toxin-antitoxin module|nr:hypothetical protein [Flavobacteriales bacterium]